jgi:hypothetical protein
MNKEIFCKGFSWGFFARSGDYLKPEAHDSMKRLVNDGCDWICITVNNFMDTYHSLNIHPVYGRTQTDEDVICAIRMAKDMGLKVCLKPMVDVLDGTWRAHVSFPMDNMDLWDKWFESYTAFMCHYARIAETNGCDMLCTGCEMAGMDAISGHCRKMIAEVRKIYHGKLMHNINHGDEFDFDWLSDVDVIGLSAYYGVTDGIHVSADDMRKGWKKHMKTLEECHKKYDRPVMFAEIGMRSEEGCSAYPYDYRRREDKKLSPEEQECFYRTAMEATWDKDWFAGYFWWDQPAVYRWPYDAATDAGFGIFGKPAEETLKEFYLTR